MALAIGGMSYGILGAVTVLAATYAAFEMLAFLAPAPDWKSAAVSILPIAAWIAGICAAINQIIGDDVRFTTWELHIGNEGFELLERASFRQLRLAGGDLATLQGLHETKVDPPLHVEGPPETALILETDDDRHVFARGLSLEDREAILTAVDAATTNT